MPRPSRRSRGDNSNELRPISHEFHSLEAEKPSVELTIVIPAYNEAERLPSMLTEVAEYLNPSDSYEIIVVDDGSTDKTAEVARSFRSTFKGRLNVFSYPQNRGKGAAVKEGVLRAGGQRVLFADADGATKFSDIAKLHKALDAIDVNGHGIAIGSRSHLEEESIAHRSAFRTFLMYGFHAIVWLLAVRSIKDTQCGFKMFTRETAQRIFPNLHVERWAFDVEILMLAEKLGIPMAEVAVVWTEVDGSKIVPVFSWIQMGIDIFFIWLYYLLGIWAVE